ncbi:CRISPR-associated CARF protein Csx1 [Thermodesulfovibrio sp. 1176]|uniref:CRISPR-associated CARF protein Csx1 n=1 Tax=unclassified Thermodesulfovibrio TaxID=2645936 RepID=UPI00083BA410|nr:MULTISPECIES: CRISPR-associated CARF protein Csx1 [unclassified Thermodesulfovibrio]MDI1471304.1 CRISPR-associated CARF protein Csx1 [Thermodesulfovibrio sp. 1176]
MIYLYQIGRLDRGVVNNEKVRFSIEKKFFESELSSFALKEHLGDKAKCVLIYPVSLPFNKGLLIDTTETDEFKKRLKSANENPVEYFKNPKKFFKAHPHTKIANDFIVIHSIGEFEKQVFEGSFDDIVLEIFIDLVERYFKDGIKELYIDISSGLNIYISALLEAVRHFSIFQKLGSWQDSLSVKLVFSEPIIGSSKSNYTIFKDYELKFKVFFSSPITKADLENFNLSRNIAKEDRTLKNKIQEMLKKFALSYSAIKNNTPLVVYSFEFHKEDDIKDLILQIVEDLKNKLYSDWQKSPQVEKNEYLKVFLALSFYMGIMRILKENSVQYKDCVSLAEIENNFSSIYQQFEMPLNEQLLKHEISNLTRPDKETRQTIIDKAKEEWQSLSEFLPGEGIFHSRNFIAHAGFERTVTEVKKLENKIYLRYKNDSLEKIKDALIKAF